MSKRKRPLQIEINETIMLNKSWAEKLAQQYRSTLINMYSGQKRRDWVREKLSFLDPTDEDIRAVASWLDDLAPYSLIPADSPPEGPRLYR